MCLYRYKAIVSYDGYSYLGFQAQEGYETIEGELNLAFTNWLHKEIKVVGSGRTDKEVHALGQVIHFDLDSEIEPDGVMRALNSFLPVDIRILEVTRVANDFHARFDAKKKEYRYRFSLKDNDVFSYRYAPYFKGLDYELMLEASKQFLGTHNFKGFCSADIDPNKDLNKTIYEINLIKEKDFMIFSFVGNAFLKYQVRRMVGLLIEIGRHKEKPTKIKEVLEKQDPKLSHKVAPGCGLTLYKVWY